MDLQFTGPTTSAGSFVASGAVADAGSADVRNLSITPIGQSDTGRLSGTETYTSPRGTIVTRFSGIAFPLSTPHGVGTGVFEIVSGSGDYAGARGRGVFEIVVDSAGNHLIGTEIGTVEQRTGR